MPWEADLIHGLQSGLSNGFTDFVFGVLTLLGDEIFVVAVMMLMFWCVSKRTGFKFLNVYFVSCAVNTVIKALVCRPRPYDLYPDRVVSIGEPSGGYSFPSGHTNSITTLSALTCVEYRKKWKIFLPIGLGLTLIVMFTRLFLGQHYLTDVLASFGIAAVLAVGLSFLFELIGQKEERIGFVGAPLALLIALLVFFLATDAETVKKTLELCGVMMSVYIGYYLEKRFIRFDVRGLWWQHILKCLVGGVVALGLYFGLKYAFLFDTSFWLYGFLRFFLMGAWLTLGAPEVFRLLKLEGK